jgi:hypothetical protein
MFKSVLYYDSPTLFWKSRKNDYGTVIIVIQDLDY